MPMIFVTDPSTFPTIRRAISKYKLANGARLNPQKSSALPVAGWAHPATALEIPFKDRLEYLGSTLDPPLPSPGVSAG